MHKAPAAGWFWLDNKIIERLPEIGKMAFVVYCVMAKHTNGERKCFITIATISKAVGATPRAIQKAVAALVNAGMIEVAERRGQNGEQRANGFHLLSLAPQGPGEPEFRGGGRTQVQGPPEREFGEGVNSGSSITRLKSNKTLVEQDKKAAFPKYEELEKDLFERWNKADGVQRCRSGALTESRRRAFRARLKNRTWQQDYHEALRKFPLKCTSGPDGWKPTLDWFLRVDTVAKILEGTYDWSKINGKHKHEIGVGQRHPDDIHGKLGEF